MSFSFTRFFLCLGFLTLLSIPLQAQQVPRSTFSAKSAIGVVDTRFGQGSGVWISEMKGTGGRPQPTRWEVIAYNSQSAAVLQKYIAQPGVALDAGPVGNRYPNDVPAGFFSKADLIVDSIAAFTIAEGEARTARIGFNRCDFLLKTREYTREPVWHLSLIDANQRHIGSVIISGTNGAVLRTIWIQKNTISGYPKIVDSLTPKGPPTNAVVISNRNSLQQPIPNQIGNPQPLSAVDPDNLIPPPPVLSGPDPVPNPVIAPPPARNTSIFKNGGPVFSNQQPIQPPPTEVTPVVPEVIDNSVPPIPTQKPTATKRISAPTVPGGR